MSKKIFRVLAVLMILGLLFGAMGPLVLSFDSDDTITPTAEETAQ